MQVRSKGTYFGPFLLSDGGVRHIKLKKQLANSSELLKMVQENRQKKDEVAILAERAQMPEDILFWIDKVDGLREAFVQYCDNLMLFSFIRYQRPDGSFAYERGFAYSIEKEENPAELTEEEQERIVTYDNGSPIFPGGPVLDVATLERTIFVNLFDVEGGFNYGPGLFPVIAHEVGHLLNNAWISKQGCGLAEFGIEAREFYAMMFERNALIGIKNALNISAGIEGEVLRAITERVIPYAHGRVLERYAKMKAYELARFSFPPGFDIDKLRLFRQYPVSMIG